DTASYANVRRMLTRRQTVPADAVRLEEMINYFHYDYPQPKAGEPFSVTTEMAPCPWNENSMLLMVGLSAKELDTSERPNSNLVFLIDVSGSMEGEDRLGLVQRSFKLLCEDLRPGDRISIVTYACGDKVVIDGATGDEKTKITQAIEDLFARGGTNGSAGIQTAYQLAEKYYIEGGNNRVILATDGDLNIGITDEGSLTRLIQEKAKSGVFLSVLGFGWGNLSDSRMEALADNGNGNYNYIDSIAEARKVLVEEMGGTLFTVAKDVKLQVEFNPALVKGYRLIGYENRTMAAEAFADDTKDGGEIGAGHQVTALYEVALKGSAQEIPEVESRYGNDDGGAQSLTSNEYLTVDVRYKEPDGDTSKLLVYPVTRENYSENMSENLSWAAGVAQAGMLLKKSEYAGTSNLKEVLDRMAKLGVSTTDDYRKEFLYLFSIAEIQ
ncbi:MAG: VWA domain-containing protein, partial [Lachnospiraceae bacterium]|nr:VWA domain-containing protein [Lachnospiraceae bacterium]